MKLCEVVSKKTIQDLLASSGIKYDDIRVDEFKRQTRIDILNPSSIEPIRDLLKNAGYLIYTFKKSANPPAAKYRFMTSKTRIKVSKVDYETVYNYLNIVISEHCYF